MNPVKKLVTIVLSMAFVVVLFVVLHFLSGPMRASSTNEFRFAQEFNETREVCYVDGLRAEGKYQILDIPETEKFSKTDSNGLTKYTVIGITDKAFQGEAQVEEVIIPATVTYIGENAFDGCSGITKVTFKGTKEEWEEMEIEAGNECLTTVTVSFE